MIAKEIVNQSDDVVVNNLEIWLISVKNRI